MKTWMMGAAALGLAVSTLTFSADTADAKGCIKGAIVGGIAGHYAGHGKIGALAGCVIGRREANKADAERAARAQPRQSPDNGRI